VTAAEKLLSLLDGVQGRDGHYRARCPAHKSRNLSLSVTDRNGAVLIHCFAGCGNDAVTTALGLTLSDLYDEPLDHERKPTRQEWHVRNAVAALAHESRILVIASSDLADGRRLSDVDVSRLALAAGRISAAYERLYGP
jgi:hypothetical protein